MRKLAAALLAVPVLALIYVPVLLRRSVAARVGLVLGVGAMLGLAAIGALLPPGSEAKPPTKFEPVASARFSTDLHVSQSPRGQVAVDFSTPMDPVSVAAALSVDPPAAVALGWNVDRTRLVVTPVAGWHPATYYTVTVGPTAHDQAGKALDGAARTAFYTRPATVGRISAASSTGERVTPGTSFTIAFDRAINVASVTRALSVDPHVAGTFEVDGAMPGPETVKFVPAKPLRPGTTYTIRLDGAVTDADGAPLAQVPPLIVTTVEAPGVVRFRPRAGTAGVPLDAPVSVRFTQPMDRAATAAAFTVTVDGKPVRGKVRWAEKDTVLVFDPAAAFAPGASVALAVSEKARSRDGAAVAASQKGTFRAQNPKPKPRLAPASLRPKPKPSPSKPVSIKPPSGTVGSGSWHAVETYYLKLMNCTRQGGWVTSSGACSSPGGRNVAPLILDAAISNRVSRPYAKRLATSGVCSHFVDGNPGTRLRRAGYPSYRWGENIGCQAGNPYRSMINTHLFYQSEKRYGGGHYVNLMNPAYTRVGIGVWVSGGRLRLVIDFYRP